MPSVSEAIRQGLSDYLSVRQLKQQEKQNQLANQLSMAKLYGEGIEMTPEGGFQQRPDYVDYGQLKDRSQAEMFSTMTPLIQEQIKQLRASGQPQQNQGFVLTEDNLTQYYPTARSYDDETGEIFDASGQVVGRF